MQQFGSTDIYFEKYDENISYMKPQLMLQNLIFGGTFMDLEGNLTAINHSSGEKCNIRFYQNDGNNLSKIEGKAFDKDGKHCIDLSGSWLNQINLYTVET